MLKMNNWNEENESARRPCEPVPAFLFPNSTFYHCSHRENYIFVEQEGETAPRFTYWKLEGLTLVKAESQGDAAAKSNSSSHTFL
jgi:hypothetical protein